MPKAPSYDLSFSNLRDGYHALWDGMEVTDKNMAAHEAKLIINAKGKYQEIEGLTGVPWFVVGVIHVREAGASDIGKWRCVLHNGEKIVGTGRKTKLVPAGRGPFATWNDAAIDALAHDGLDKINWYDGYGPEHVAFALESFNGFGYRLYRHVPSCYLWANTNRQKIGKYESDGKWNPTMMDTQNGGMALLRELIILDKSVTFQRATAPATTEPGQIAPSGGMIPVGSTPEAPQKPVEELPPTDTVEGTPWYVRLLVVLLKAIFPGVKIP